MDARKNPVLLARNKSIPLEYVAQTAKEPIIQSVMDKFFAPEILKRQWSWSDRLINSCLVYPHCSLLHYEYDTKRWLTECFPEYWGERPLYVCNDFSPYGALYRLEYGKDFEVIFPNSTLYGEMELFFFDEERSYLICYSEIENILIYGGRELMAWVQEKARQLGERVPNAFEAPEPSPKKEPGMLPSYHMVFDQTYSGGLNKHGGLPTHLPEEWPQMEGSDLTFLFQIYCEDEKLIIPNTLCIQGYQLIEDGDYNSDIVILPLPLDAKENTAHIGLADPNFAEGDISFQEVMEYEDYDWNIRNQIAVFGSKLQGWCPEELLAHGRFLGQIYDEDPFVIGANYTMCLFLNEKGQIEVEYQ